MKYSRDMRFANSTSGIGIDEDDFFLLLFPPALLPNCRGKLNTLAECRVCRQRHQRNNYPQFHNDILATKR